MMLLKISKKAAEDVKDAVDGAISGVKNVLHKDDK